MENHLCCQDFQTCAPSDVLIGLAIDGAILGGLALFWIARQDGNHSGRVLGVLFPILAILAAIYLTVGHHWLWDRQPFS